MSISNIIEKSKELFTNFETVNDTLYRGNYQINDKLAGIYYLNFADTITKKDFDELQYKYLAEEFYKNEDSLQWNIYLLFINSNISDELKTTILTDDKYARKFIFQEDEFLDYFELEKSNQTSLPNIVSQWKSELKKVDLQEVYSEAFYTEAVQNFLENSTIKEVDGGISKDLSNTPIIERISRIHLDKNYRNFPLKRDFEFGIVNLINGANGTGKTSLLESLELILTGKTNRNSDKDESSESITAVLNNTIEDVYTPNDIRKYKSRDIKWYNRNHLIRGNNCYQSFSQFNFFNTDAAYQFASSDHEDQINESLKQIILGAEYSFLRDRINGFESRLGSELTSLETRFKEQTEFIKNNQTKLINDLKSDSSLDDYRRKITDDVLALKFKDNFLVENYSISNLSINELKTETEYIVNQNLVFDFNTLTNLKNQTEELLRFVNSQRETYYLRIDQRIDLLNQQKDSEAKRNKTISFLKYFVIEDFGSLENIEERLQAHNFTLAKLGRIKKEFSLLNLDSFLIEQKDFDELKKLKSEDLQTVINDRKETENEIKILNENFSNIEEILNQIKLLGKDFLSHNEHSQNCPLCEQQISHDELFQKLDADFKSNIDKSILDQKSKKLTGLKTKEERLVSELRTLNNLKIIVQDEISDYEALTVKEITLRLNTILSNEEEILLEMAKFETTLDQLSSIGGTLSELKYLQKEIGSILKAETSFEKKDIEKLLSDLENDLKNVNETIEKLDEENNKLITSLNKSLKLKEPIKDFSLISDWINSRDEKVKALESSFLIIKEHLNLEDNKSISELSKDLNRLEKNIKSLKDFENRQSELQRITKELETAKSFILKNTNKHDRLKKAVQTLTKLKSNDEEGVLDDYFKDNLKEIKDIFKTIHSPQEFSDLKFENKKLILYKNKDRHTISQISTGQRAALVISIFISLNRKLKNGPNVIIFDDPVTFIDDFNALSFLDFLRYFIVKEKKQIFFATANKKFSTLFKKKFEFLEEGYQEFELMR